MISHYEIEVYLLRSKHTHIKPNSIEREALQEKAGLDTPKYASFSKDSMVLMFKKYPYMLLWWLSKVES